jgi:hypothetical protein
MSLLPGRDRLAKPWSSGFLDSLRFVQKPAGSIDQKLHGARLDARDREPVNEGTSRLKKSFEITEDTTR